MSAAALALHDIHKRFGATQALAGASCVVTPGRVHALLGENGAGKTTLMRVAFGMVQPDRGSITRDGSSLRFTSERDAISAGIGMVHQHFMLVPAFTVAENAALGGQGRFDAARAGALVRRIGDETGLHLDPNAKVATLPVGAQQRAEIVRAEADVEKAFAALGRVQFDNDECVRNHILVTETKPLVAAADAGLGYHQQYRRRDSLQHDRFWPGK